MKKLLLLAMATPLLAATGHCLDLGEAFSTARAELKSVASKIRGREKPSAPAPGEGQVNVRLVYQVCREKVYLSGAVCRAEEYGEDQAFPSGQAAALLKAFDAQGDEAPWMRSFLVERVLKDG